MTPELCPCGNSLDTGEGWDGWCGTCADRRERGEAVMFDAPIEETELATPVVDAARWVS